MIVQGSTFGSGFKFTTPVSTLNFEQNIEL
jgi:hypothetical protein